MSVSILEVIEAGGYDLTTKEDCQWLLAQESAFKELIDEAENTIAELEAEAMENCKHEDTTIDTVDNTDNYEYEQARGNTSYGLRKYSIEYCNFCGKQRDLPGGKWSE